MFTLFSTSVLCLIIIGSSIAFNIILSFGNAAMFSSNSIVICCLLRKRFIGEPLPPARFSLGKAGLPINIIALCYLLFAGVFVLFPSVPNPTLIAMNWSVVIFGSLVIFSMIYYFFYGRYNYEGPVEYVKKME
jgi:choline transport protein